LEQSYLVCGFCEELMRYHVHGHFVEEQRRGVPVHHQIEKDVDDALLVAEILNAFTSGYDQKSCYGLSIGISEEPSLVE